MWTKIDFDEAAQVREARRGCVASPDETIRTSATSSVESFQGYLLPFLVFKENVQGETTWRTSTLNYIITIQLLQIPELKSS